MFISPLALSFLIISQYGNTNHCSSNWSASYIYSAPPTHNHCTLRCLHAEAERDDFMTKPAIVSRSTKTIPYNHNFRKGGFEISNHLDLLDDRIKRIPITAALGVAYEVLFPTPFLGHFEAARIETSN